MEQRGIGVDELAAHNLLIALGVSLSVSNLSTAAKHFKAHREGAESLQMERAQISIREHLETAFMENRSLQEGDRAFGYAVAEQETMNWFYENVPQKTERAPISKGRMLRSMMRAKKQENAIITRRRP